MCSFGDPGVQGVKHVLNCITSTSHSNDVLQNFLFTISNFSSESLTCAELVVNYRALEFLQPVVLHDDLLISLAACSVICTLAAEKKFFLIVDRCEVLPVIEDVLRIITPGTLHDMSQWSTVGIQRVAFMMSVDAHPAVQLCALHMIGKSFHMETNRVLFSTANIVNLFRTLAASPDPFVFAAAAYLMRMIHIPVPNYRATKVEGTGDKQKIPVSDWSVDMVCQWVRGLLVVDIFWACTIIFRPLVAIKFTSQVASKSFRIYRHIFRDGFVNGQMLMSLTNDILEQNKISNIWHRQAILFAVAQLREASEHLTSGRLNSMGEVTASCNISTVQICLLSLAKPRCVNVYNAAN